MLSAFRNQIPAASAAFLAATIAAGCSSELSCAETATCAPRSVDAQADREPSDVEDARSHDAGDAPIVDGDASPADRADTTIVVDVSREADSPRLDVANDDRAGGDRSDAAGSDTSGADANPDTAVCNVDAGRSPTDDPCIVNERYGVFVSPTGSDATGAGTRNAPFRTLNRGLQAAKAETMRVFACDNGAGYADPINIDATLDGLAVFGGFECTGWTRAAAARTHVHPPAGPALTITGLAIGVIFENFALQSADAAIGASSIAVQVHASQQIVFRNTRIVAGKGGAGRPGTHGGVGTDGVPSGVGQRGRSASCVPPILSQAGGVAATGSCGSKGGNGGACDTIAGSLAGESGTPLTGVDPPNQANGGTNWIHDRLGRKGSDGVAGVGGTANSKAGSFSATGYMLAAPGGDGTEGHAAQGGGGGSGGQADAPNNRCIGATGGAGGMGGCGGGYGSGGGAGGASVALLSWTSGVMLDKCELISGDGGPGGNGGNGGAGGKGSEGAVGGEGILDSDAGVSLDPAGNGGPGGAGGPGGGGAGGNGGPTYGIVYAGGRPSQLGGTTVARGSGGLRGLGGIASGAATPDGGVADAGTFEAGADGSLPDGGFVTRAADGLPGDAAYELAIP